MLQSPQQTLQQSIHTQVVQATHLKTYPIHHVMCSIYYIHCFKLAASWCYKVHLQLHTHLVFSCDHFHDLTILFRIHGFAQTSHDELTDFAMMMLDVAPHKIDKGIGDV